jgi:hypothetical protein
MQPLKRSDIFSLEQYAEIRDAFRAQVMNHKRHRRLPIGDHAALYFEDRLTIQYQIQEMLRIERIFEAAGIEEELAVYNPLIPDGRNWKATFMIEYGDVDERRRALARFIGIEIRTFMQVDGFPPTYAISNEDLDRSSDDKTASVHFMRFELTPEMCAAVKQGATIYAGIDHPEYTYRTTASDEIRQAIASDID